jgi:hypothetical protein
MPDEALFILVAREKKKPACLSAPVFCGAAKTF